MNFFGNERQKSTRSRDTFLKIPKVTRGHAAKLERELKLRTTSSAVVLKLPSEITAKIFKYVQLFYRGGSEDLDVGDADWCWLTITHVCKVWRKIAIGTQDLWTHIDIERLSCAEQTAIYLERSGSSELYVDYNCTKHEEVSSLQCLFLALEHIHRIQELHIWYSPVTNLAELPEEMRVALLLSEAPALRSFTFITSFAANISLDVRTLFQDVAPRLTALRLFVDSPSWTDIPVIRRLKNLNIMTVSSYIYLHEIYSIFLANPNIATISLSSVKNASHIQVSNPLPTSISLPFMEDFDITADFDVLRQLFQVITTPNLLGWDIRCTSYPQAIRLDPVANSRSILPHIYTEKECDSLKISISPYFVRLEANYSNTIRENVYDNERPRRSLDCSRSYEDEGDPTTVSGDFSHVCSMIEGGFWCTAKSLWIEFNADVPDGQDLSLVENLESPWTRVLLLFPTLQELTVRRCGPISDFMGGYYTGSQRDTHCGLLDALRKTFVDDEGRTALISPHLNHLRLVKMDFPLGSSHLVDVLRLRASYGSKLHRLALDEQFGLTEPILDTFDKRELVDGVMVDNVLISV